MAVVSLILFFCDALFFGALYLVLALLLNRPPLPLTASSLFLIFALVFWYYRLYRLEVYLERQRSLARLFSANLVVLMVFGAVWFFLLKAEWPLASRLLHLLMIPAFGLFYAFLPRAFLAGLLLRRLPVWTLLGERDQAVFNERWAPLLPRARTVKSPRDIPGRTPGFVFLSYRPGADIASRAAMWSDYLEQLQSIRRDLAGTKSRVFVFNPYNQELQGGFFLLYLGDIPALEFNPGRRAIYRRFCKRLLDILASVLLLPLLVLLHPLVYLLALSSFGRPVLFRQLRIGRDGKPFKLFKYRTMDLVYAGKPGQVDPVHLEFIEELLAEEEKSPFQPDTVSPVARRLRKLRQRRESSSVGLFLRKTSIDELPQLINVLSGRMSLVGPRPALPYEIEIYPAWSGLRHRAPQGLTGLWQSSGRGLMPLHTSLFLDCYYALESSFWLDVFTLFKTARSLWDFTRIY